MLCKRPTFLSREVQEACDLASNSSNPVPFIVCVRWISKPCAFMHIIHLDHLLCNLVSFNEDIYPQIPALEPFKIFICICVIFSDQIWPLNGSKLWASGVGMAWADSTSFYVSYKSWFLSFSVMVIVFKVANSRAIKFVPDNKFWWWFKLVRSSLKFLK